MDSHKNEPHPIMHLLRTKAATKQTIFNNTFKVFNTLKKVAQDFAATNNEAAMKINKNITIEFTDKGKFDGQLKVAGDMLYFNMHSNVFEFPRNHVIWKSSYVKEDQLRSYCGVIFIYNFLADSFRYERVNDAGYLVARIFVNKEFHFIVEGKRQMAFLNNEFIDKKISREHLHKILETAIVYCLDFDLLLPSYDDLKEVTLSAMLEQSQNTNLRTGKRLGFGFQADAEEKLIP
jgi:hypothetical protein